MLAANTQGKRCTKALIKWWELGLRHTMVLVAAVAAVVAQSDRRALEVQVAFVEGSFLARVRLAVAEI